MSTMDNGAVVTPAVNEVTREAVLRLSIAEFCHALAIYSVAVMLRPGEHRNMKIGEALGQIEIWTGKVRGVLG
jgi:hypothetical protein